MSATGQWWTAPAESDDGKLIMVTGRSDVEKFRTNPRFNVRAEITWRYTATPSGMPDVVTSRLMEDVDNALRECFDKDPVAVLTGVYTGDGQRNWVFYTLSVNIFGRKINEALAPFDLLPIEIYTENDPRWEEYDEMSQSAISPE